MNRERTNHPRSPVGPSRERAVSGTPSQRSSILCLISVSFRVFRGCSEFLIRGCSEFLIRGGSEFLIRGGSEFLIRGGSEFLIRG